MPAMIYHRYSAINRYFLACTPRLDWEKQKGWGFSFFWLVGLGFFWGLGSLFVGFLYFLVLMNMSLFPHFVFIFHVSSWWWSLRTTLKDELYALWTKEELTFDLFKPTCSHFLAEKFLLVPGWHSCQTLNVIIWRSAPTQKGAEKMMC